MIEDQALRGNVIRTESGRVWVEAEGRTVSAVLRGRLKKEWLRVTSLVVVGDEVELAITPDGSAVVEAIMPRRTVLARPGFAGYEHVIAANVDQLVIVTSVYSPPFRRGLVDRFTLLARRGQMEPVLVVNKCDLGDPRQTEALVAPLAAAGVRILLASAATGEGLEGLKELLTGRVSVMAGQSGVGKSTLLNAIATGVSARTGEVNTHARGRHTTTSSQMYPLPFGGWLVDTPGIKELSVGEVEEGEMEEAFPEIAALAGGCRFRDCSHTHEPGCAVKAALAGGELEESRYRGYRRLQGR